MSDINNMMRCELEDEIIRLSQQLSTTERLLAESQAREKEKDEALQMFVDCYAFIPSLTKQSDDDAEQDESRRNVVYSVAVRAIQMSSDSTALDAALKASYELGRQQMQLSCDMERDTAIAKAKREVLLEASNRALEEQWLGAACVDGLRRMADELKGGEQG